MRLNQNQATDTERLDVTGEIRGLPAGHYRLLLHNEDCQTADTENMIAEIDEIRVRGDVSKIKNTINIQNMEVDSAWLVIWKCDTTSGGGCNLVKPVLDCAEISRLCHTRDRNPTEKKKE